MQSYLRRIFEEIDKEITGEYKQLYEVEFKILLNSLIPKEKFIVGKYFVDIGWNIGSLKVLLRLQECGILSATQYILSQDDKNDQNDNTNHIQLVLSDFLELNFELLGNFLTHCEFSNNIKLKSYLEDCIFRLMKDFEIDQNIIKKNYMKEVKLIVCDSVYINFKLLHLTCLLELEKFNIKIAFNEFNNWINNFTKENTTTNFYEILKEIIVNDYEALEKYLFKPSQDQDFKNWKYFVILLYIAGKYSNEEFSKTIKNYIKDLFKIFIGKMTKHLCLTLLITARVFYLSISENDENLLQNYTQWYKSIFSDMKFTISTKEFRDVIEILTDLIAYENNPKFLQVHGSISISPAAFCNDIVLKYKNSCRLKIASFVNNNKNNKNLDINESIVIDDD